MKASEGLITYKLKELGDMFSLTRYDQDGLEIFINTETGESFASQSGLARMCNVSETAIRKWKTSNQIEAKTTEIPTGTGFKTSNLFSENAILLALEKYNPQLLAQCAKAGIRVLMHKLAGYEINSTAQPQTRASIDLPKMTAEAKQAMGLAEAFLADKNEINKFALSVLGYNNPDAAPIIEELRKFAVRSSPITLQAKKPENDCLKLILDISEVGKPVSARNLQQSSRVFKRIKPEVIRGYFAKLAKQGYGQVIGEGKRTQFVKFKAYQRAD